MVPEKTLCYKSTLRADQNDVTGCGDLGSGVLAKANKQEPSTLQLRLEIKNGPLAGRKISVAAGQTVTVGRTHRSNFPISHDTFLSGVHFALECDGTVCRLLDKQSANGTFVNGTRVTEVALRDGDDVAAGSTKFKVRVEDAPPDNSPVLPPQEQVLEPRLKDLPIAEEKTPIPQVSTVRTHFQVGSWTFQAIPDGWQQIDAYGIRSAVKGQFPAEAMVTEDVLSGGTFAQFIDSQLSLVREFVTDPQIERTEPARIAGASEVETYTIRYGTDDGRRFVQRQIYARAGKRVGGVTLTTLESELAKVRPELETIVAGLVLQPDPEA